jgi:hypothetical protein
MYFIIALKAIQKNNIMLLHMLKFIKMKSTKCMKLNTLIYIFIIIILFGFTVTLIKNYEGFNTDFPQTRYKPYKSTPIPIARDGTSFLSPDIDGNCPSGFERDKTNTNSLCHAVCKEGKFYYDDSTVGGKPYGCVVLNTEYPQTNYSKATYPFAKDQKTNIVSPNIDATCPNMFDLDLTSGLCYTNCPTDKKFYGQVGCVKLNTSYLQSNYTGTEDNPYPIAADQKTEYVSPTSNAECPNGFTLDYPSGLCYTTCRAGTKFNGDRSGSTIVGCI